MYLSGTLRQTEGNGQITATALYGRMTDLQFLISTHLQTVIYKYRSVPLVLASLIREYGYNAGV